MKQTEKDIILRVLSLLERKLLPEQHKAYEDAVSVIENLPDKPHK